LNCLAYSERREIVMFVPDRPLQTVLSPIVGILHDKSPSFTGYAPYPNHPEKPAKQQHNSK
jgi:hypothetical protein